MKLNRIMLGATAAVLVVGSTALVGYNREADPQTVVAEQTAVEQQGDSLDTEGATQNASTDVGVESYAHGGGSHGGGSHAGAAHGGGFHGGGHAGGVGHGGYGRGGYGHGYGYNHGGWGGGGRWGRWGGGRYVGGRWVGGPYYGWCNDRYYSCERAWY